MEAWCQSRPLKVNTIATSGLRSAGSDTTFAREPRDDALPDLPSRTGMV